MQITGYKPVLPMETKHKKVWIVEGRYPTLARGDRIVSFGGGREAKAIVSGRNIAFLSEGGRFLSGVVRGLLSLMTRRSQRLRLIQLKCFPF